MRKVEEMIERAKKAGFELYQQEIDGCMFVNRKQRQSIICSWGGGWEHVSYCRWDRDPSWSEMCQMKETFWDDDEWVVEFHPPKAEYVNNAKHCLHLWRPLEQFVGKLPTPPSIFTGIKDTEMG